MEKKQVDVIVVGGGPSGVAAAITLARAGKEVVLVERGTFAGSKNVFGGAIYTQPTAEIFPEFWKTAPLERANNEHRYAILGENDGTTISYKSNVHSEDYPANSYTVLRAKWDRWCAQQAEEAGAYIIPETLVKNLLVEDGKVVGITTELEDFRSKIVIIADGVNSLLAKQLGLHNELQPEQVALGVKEVITLPKEKIQDRFNLEDNSGVIYEILGGPMSGILGLGYIYTNLNSVVVGIGVSLEELKERKLKPYEILNQLKTHPSIRTLIEGGTLQEYSAHLIPEGGFNSMPKLYTHGALVVGDAAMLVNNVHWEGTNLALISGKLAAETAIEALENNDFSENMLSLYAKKMNDSFLMKDLKSYKDVMHFAEKNAATMLGYYPNKINEFFNMFTTVDSVPKKEKFIKFITKVLKERNINMAADGLKILKIIGGVLK